jgi:hypothetical protein
MKGLSTAGDDGEPRDWSSMANGNIRNRYIVEAFKE